MKLIKDWVKDLPERKKYIDVITAIMTVPILLTVMVTNFANLSNNKNANAASRTENKPSPTISEVIKIVPIEVHNDTNDTTFSKQESTISTSPTPTVAVNNIALISNPTSSPSCKKEVGPVSIVVPEENETVNSSPTCIDISYKSGDYCSVTWSYRIDGGSWSEYMDRSICIHNLANGAHKLELKIKSTASADETLLIRNFTYSGQSSATATATTAPTNTPTPTESISTTSAELISN